MGSKPPPVDKPKVAEAQDEEGEGRSSVGRTKRRPDFGKAVAEDAGSDGGDLDPSTATKQKEPGRSSKRTRSYLDEVLAEKERKKQKKKSKNKANPPDRKD